MSLFSDNIRHLRMKKEVSQAIVAENLAITRDRLAKYEEGKSQPPFEILIKLSHYYHISIDLLLTADIRKVDIDGLMQLEDNRILLPIAVDREGENTIEIIPHKARAGYLSGYSDPEFIESLQHISLPFLPQIQGFSCSRGLHAAPQGRFFYHREIYRKPWRGAGRPHVHPADPK